MTLHAMWTMMLEASPKDSPRLSHLVGLLAGQERADLAPSDEGARSPLYVPYIAELAGDQSILDPAAVSLGMKLAVAFNPYHAYEVCAAASALITGNDNPVYLPHARRKCGIVLGIFEVMNYLDQEFIEGRLEDDLAAGVDELLPTLLESLLTCRHLALDEMHVLSANWPEFSEYQGRLSNAIKAYARGRGEARRVAVKRLLLAAGQAVNYPTPRPGFSHTVGQLTSEFGYEVLEQIWWAEVAPRSTAEKLAMITWEPSLG